MKFYIFLFLSFIFCFSIYSAEYEEEASNREYQTINIHFDTIEDQKLFIQQAKKLPGKCGLICGDGNYLVSFSFDKPYDKEIITKLIQQNITSRCKEIFLSKYNVEFVEH